MKHLPSTALFTSLAASLALGAAGCSGCGKSAPEPGAGSTERGAPSAGADAAAAALEAWKKRFPRDDAGHLIPRHTTPPPVDPSLIPPKPSRDPDWDLDVDDPARDYVRRYAVGTHRYGDDLGCVDIGPSQPAGDKRSVEVKTAASCPGAGTQLDVFLVDVAGDRLTVDDKSRRNALTRWPDGSDPEGPPNPPQSMEDMRRWTGPLKQQFQQLLLVPIRVQTYGRGTYPVVTIAGWHASVTPSTPMDDLRAVAERLCKADGDMPLGIFAGINRSQLLRIRCRPPEARWDKL
jgi:hypothetical protein